MARTNHYVALVCIGFGVDMDMLNELAIITFTVIIDSTNNQ